MEWPKDAAQISDMIAAHPTAYRLEVKAIFFNVSRQTIHCAVEVRTERDDSTAKGTFCSIGLGASLATPEHALQRAIINAFRPGALVDVPTEAIKVI